MFTPSNAIYRGITTGLNEAFIIDNQTKEALIAQDPRSEEMIKPVLRGQDIGRYRANWAGKWLIATFPTLGVDIDEFPAIKRHLLSFGKGRLMQVGERHPDGSRSRKKTGNDWFELQDTCAYHAEFLKEKLLWIELVDRGRFAYDNNGYYGEATTFLLTGGPIKYLCAVLNAKLVRWCLEKMAPTSGTGTLRWKKIYVEQLPIPKVSRSNRKPFDRMIDRILRSLSHEQSSKTVAAEAQIDRMVYQLYGLTASEIAAVEERI